MSLDIYGKVSITCISGTIETAFPRSEGEDLAKKQFHFSGSLRPKLQLAIW